MNRQNKGDSCKVSTPKKTGSGKRVGKSKPEKACNQLNRRVK